jgi:hypothetical protein
MPDRSRIPDRSTLPSPASAAPPGASSRPESSVSRAPSACTSPAPPSVVATPPRPSTTRLAPSSAAARISSPTPWLVAVSGASDPAGSKVSPHAWAASMTAVPSSIASDAVTGCPAGPRTAAPIRRYPAATAASTVPSPPSATGVSTISPAKPPRARPDATRAATCSADRLPLNLSGATTT